MFYSVRLGFAGEGQLSVRGSHPKETCWVLKKPKGQAQDTPRLVWVPPYTPLYQTAGKGQMKGMGEMHEGSVSGAQVSWVTLLF